MTALIVTTSCQEDGSTLVNISIDPAHAVSPNFVHTEWTVPGGEGITFPYQFVSSLWPKPFLVHADYYTSWDDETRTGQIGASQDFSLVWVVRTDCVVPETTTTVVETTVVGSTTTTKPGTPEATTTTASVKTLPPTGGNTGGPPVPIGGAIAIAAGVALCVAATKRRFAHN